MLENILAQQRSEMSPLVHIMGPELFWGSVGLATIMSHERHDAYARVNSVPSADILSSLDYDDRSELIIQNYDGIQKLPSIYDADSIWERLRYYADNNLATLDLAASNSAGDWARSSQLDMWMRMVMHDLKYPGSGQDSTGMICRRLLGRYEPDTNPKWSLLYPGDELAAKGVYHATRMRRVALLDCRGGLSVFRKTTDFVLLSQRKELIGTMLGIVGVNCAGYDEQVGPCFGLLDEDESTAMDGQRHFKVLRHPNVEMALEASLRKQRKSLDLIPVATNYHISLELPDDCSTYAKSQT
jgi:hypothetical protein